MDNDRRRAEFVTAAAALFEEKGHARTSIRDVTDRMGVTRSLFYHYFPNKEALTNAVIDEQVDTFMARIQQLDDSFDSDRQLESLQEFVSSFRALVLGENSFGGCVMREKNLELHLTFTLRCANRLADHYAHLRRINAEERRHESLNLVHLRETMYVLSTGIISLLYHEPEVCDEALLEVVANALSIRLD